MNILQLGRLLSAFWSGQDSVIAIEYALLAALIFGAILVSVGLLGDTVKSMYDEIASIVVNAMP